MDIQNKTKKELISELQLLLQENNLLKALKEKEEAEFIIANKELIFQNEEKEKRAAELIIANKELNILINKSKQAEEEIALERNKLKAAFENMFIGFVLCDSHGGNIIMNETALRYHGFTSAEDMHHRVEEYANEWKLYYTDGRLMTFDEWPLPRAIRGEFLKNFELIYHHLKSNNKWICNFTSMPVYNSVGEVTQIAITMFDITEQKQAQDEIRKLNETLEIQVEERTAELHESEKSFRNLANNISQLAWKADEQGSIFWYNQRWFDYTGTTIEEMSGWGWQKVYHPDYVQRVVDKIKHCFETGEVWEDTFPLRGKDGLYRWFLSRAVPIRDEQGKIYRWFGTNTDITDRKLVEIELQATKAEAERANLAKSEFLSRMSHELRTPMNSILGFAQLMNMGELTPAHKKGVDHILKSGKHLLDLINEVLDLSRIEAGELSISLEPVHLHGIVSETMDVIKPLATVKNITVEFPESPVCDLFVNADRQKLKQVLLNLLSNAVKYNREGGSLKVECEVRRPKDSVLPAVRISINDTGKGIAPEYMERLFNPFERVGAEISEVEGTGLGLAVSKKLIEAMNGTIGVESEPGIGSTFWIEVPQAEGQIDRHERKGGFNKPETESVVNGTLLYIEDNVSNIQLVEQILEMHRPQVRLITEMYGKRTVRLATDYKPDVILLDLDLPDIHGSEVLKLLLADNETKSIPVVVLSADAKNDQIEKLLKAGAKNYLTKPLDVLEFLKVVDMIIKPSGKQSNKH